MENTKQKQPAGSLKISQEVLATIARVAALEIEGVAEIAPPARSMGKLFTRGSKSDIHIDLKDDFAVVDVALNLKFGAKITEVCSAVQNNIKNTIQTMTGMAVSKVNVRVAGIAFQEDEAITRE